MPHHGDHDSAAVSVTEHRERILLEIPVLPAVSVPLAHALGLTLAEAVRAHIDVPGFDNSAMDGYAVRLADVATASPDSPVTLVLVADLPAGSGLNPELRPGEAARIMTGAPVPSSADCIVPVEDTDQFEGFDTPLRGYSTSEGAGGSAGNDQFEGFDTPLRGYSTSDRAGGSAGSGGAGLPARVLIRLAPKPAAHIRRTGSDVQVGETVLDADRILNARDLAAAAATGSSTLLVHPAPRVGVLSTGSELLVPGASLRRGQIHDSNSILLAAAVAECGGVPVQLGAVPDDDDALRQVFEKHAHEVDAFVTSGGVSVGAYDVVKAVLAPLGVWFGPVRMQPGKPQGFGFWRASDGQIGPPIFALPGNPVSVFVSFEEFVRPALLKMQGRHDLARPLVQGTVTEGWRSPAGRAQVMPVIAEQQQDGVVAIRPASAGGSGSYLVASLAGANALARIPESVTEVHEGDLVDVTLVS